MKILFFLLSATICFAQNPVLIDERDVTVIKVKPEQPRTLGLAKGTSYVPSYITLEGIDTSKSYKVTITVTPSATPVPTEPQLKEVINDAHARIVTSGTWVRVANQSYTVGFHENNFSYTTTVGATASLEFTGKKVEIVSEQRNNHGVAKIEILQGAKVVQTATVDTYHTTTANGPSVIFSSQILPQGTYTVKFSLLSVSGTRDSIVLDKISVFE